MEKAYTNKNVVVVTNPRMYRGGGIATATESLFSDKFPILKSPNLVTEQLLKFETILFSGFEPHWADEVLVLKENNKKVLIYWHFGMPMLTEPPLLKAFEKMNSLALDGLVDNIVFCKEGMKESYASLYPGLNTFFLLKNLPWGKFRNTSKKEKIGIYIGSGGSEYWVKNAFTAVAAAAMTDRTIDFLPLDRDLVQWAEQFGAKFTGEYFSLQYEDFIRRLSTECELALNISFTETSPMLPLEALNNGVLCLTGNNHHFWREVPALREFLVVDTPDDPYSVYLKIEVALANKEEILRLYEEWKTDYDIRSDKNMSEFLALL